MADLKDAILDAKYIDMISLADFVVRDCGLPDTDSDGNYLPQATDIAASLFRWAADVQATGMARAPRKGAADAEETGFLEYDENGDPLMDAEEAARLEAERQAREKDGS